MYDLYGTYFGEVTLETLGISNEELFDLINNKESIVLFFKLNDVIHLNLPTNWSYIRFIKDTNNAQISLNINIEKEYEQCWVRKLSMINKHTEIDLTIWWRKNKGMQLWKWEDSNLQSTSSSISTDIFEVLDSK